MLTNRILLPASAVLFCLALAAGCSDAYSGRREISGMIKLQDQPLKEGSITFLPLDGQETQSGAPIQNGEYKLPRKNGLMPGKYRVQITSGDGKTPTEEQAGAPGSSNIVSVDLIPEDWNVNSKQQIEVKSSGDNKFNFDIPNINTPKKKR